jgi:hypothetical protein
MKLHANAVLSLNPQLRMVAVLAGSYSYPRISLP